MSLDDLPASVNRSISCGKVRDWEGVGGGLRSPGASGTVKQTSQVVETSGAVQSRTEAGW